MTDEGAVPATVHRLRELVLLLEQHGRAFAARTGLGPTDIRALIRLLDHERGGTPASPSALARELGLTTASTTVLLDRLERAGHVRRAPRTDDRRRVDVTVTGSAKDLGWAFFGPLIAATSAVLATRTAEERDTIDRFLTELTQGIAAAAPTAR
jgi:DNA-binding MarR family transcriptional regulator